ncbi:MAG: repressor LexA [Chloroflexi bacterium]|nr:repressor LexA [Chloroflexota bacterium]
MRNTVKKQKALSPKRRRILAFIEEFLREHGYPPTVRDIQHACDISSTSVVDYNLRALERSGHLKRDREVSRGIGLPGLSPAGPRMTRVPLLGAIAAGEPLSLPPSGSWADAALETIEVPQDLLKDRGRVFAVKVKGTSMIDALIDDGDVVLLKQTKSAQDGDMVAAWLKLEQAVTLKKLYRDKGRVRLQPANAQMSPLYVRASDIEILGKVVGVLRQFA